MYSKNKEKQLQAKSFYVSIFFFVFEKGNGNSTYVLCRTPEKFTVDFVFNDTNDE